MSETEKPKPKEVKSRVFGSLIDVRCRLLGVDGNNGAEFVRVVAEGEIEIDGRIYPVSLVTPFMDYPKYEVTTEEGIELAKLKNNFAHKLVRTGLTCGIQHTGTHYISTGAINEITHHSIVMVGELGKDDRPIFTKEIDSQGNSYTSPVATKDSPFDVDPKT